MAHRAKIRTLLLATALLSPFVAGAAGVPNVDLKKLALEVLNIEQEVQKTAAEQAENEERLKIAKTQTDQLAALDETIELLTETSKFVPDLEGAGAAGAGYSAAEIYAIDDNNPYADRLFGDARVTIEQMIAETAIKYGGHPALAKAGVNTVEFRCWFQGLVKQESNFSVGAVSHVGASGLTQIMPGTFDYLGIPMSKRGDPRVQLDGGARYLLEQLNKFGSMPLALAAYNAGPGAVMKYNGIPPYKETQDYVVKITGYYNRYAARVSGADQVGTLDPKDMVIAESSNIASAGAGYAAESMNTMAGAAVRLREILGQIDQTGSVKSAMDLNTYAKFEVARIAAILTRLQAAQRKVEAARYALLLQAYAEDEVYLNMKLEN